MFAPDPQKLGRKLSKVIEDYHYKFDLRDRVIALIERGADVNAYPHDVPSPLCAALKRGKTDIAQLLIENGADVNKVRMGRPPLYYAMNYRSCFDLLISHGADPLAVTRDGTTLLMVAMEQKDMSLVDVLVAAGNDIHAQDNWGETALTKALRQRNIAGVEYLLQRGVDANAPVKPSGDTPLHIAARGGYDYIVDLLLTKGADPSLRNERGQTSIEVAADYGHKDLVQKLAAVLKTREEKSSLQASAGWHKLGDREIAHVALREPIGYRLTEIFNFGSGTYTQIATNLLSGAESQSILALEACAAVASDAAQKLEDMGGHSGGYAAKAKPAALLGKKPAQG